MVLISLVCLVFVRVLDKVGCFIVERLQLWKLLLIFLVNFENVLCMVFCCCLCMFVFFDDRVLNFNVLESVLVFWFGNLLNVCSVLWMRLILCFDFRLLIVGLVVCVVVGGIWMLGVICNLVNGFVGSFECCVLVVVVLEGSDFWL